MKEEFETSTTISIRQLSLDDLHTYKGFCNKLPDPERYKQYWENEGDRLFNSDGANVMFGLWDNDKLIGQTVIAFDPDNRKRLAVFCESEIDPEYRGKGLAKSLYDARKQYVEEIGFKGEIETHIKPDNIPSLKAANRNGFFQTGEMHKGYCVLKAT